jgi:hypothetical protein
MLSTAEDKTDESMPSSVHFTTWQSAESDLPTTRDLRVQELEKEDVEVSRHWKMHNLSSVKNLRLAAWAWPIAIPGLHAWWLILRFVG